jgi:hypothetical protein
MIARFKSWLKSNLDLILGGLALIASIISAFFLGRTGWPFRHFKPAPYNPGEPRHFKDSAEFINWYQSNFPPGYWDLAFPAPGVEQSGDSSKVWCDDRADFVRRKALSQGFVVSDALTLGGIYYGVKVTSTMGGHNACIARCGSEYWFVDENTGDFCKVCGIY